MEARTGDAAELDARGREPDPVTGARLRGEARALAASGSTKEALSRVGQSLHHEPFDADGTLLRGQLEAALGWHKPALDTFTEALELDPASASIHAERARSLRAARRGPRRLRRAAAASARRRRQSRGDLPTLYRARPHERISGVRATLLFQ